MAAIGGSGALTRRDRIAWVGIGLSAAVMALLAARRDLAPGALTPAATTADVAVGVAFVAGALAAPVGWRARLPFAAVGIAWFAGSIVPAMALVYLAVLAAALALFPRGRVSSRRDGVAVALSLASLAPLLPGAIPPFGSLPPRPVLAALFTAVAITAWAGRRWERAAAWYPLLAGIAVAAVLAGGWFVETSLHAAYDAALWALALDLVLLGVALGMPLAAWAVRRERAQLADRLLAHDRGTGLDGLASILGEVLGDRGLRVVRLASGTADTGSAGGNVGVDLPAARSGGGGGSEITVDDGAGERLAVIVGTRPAGLEDPETRAAVIDAVRLTAMNERWQERQRAQLAELEAARGRLISATDRQRASIAARLHDDVLPAIDAAAAELRAVDGEGESGVVAAALETARQELDASSHEVLALTRGLPPATLGQGRLAAAVSALAARCPIPATVAAASDTAADADAETALFYVCSEAIANAIKHAGARSLAIDLGREGERVALRVADDGRGGADPQGMGLRGLADRLDACGGRLRVESPPGAGTTLTAWVPAARR